MERDIFRRFSRSHAWMWAPFATAGLFALVVHHAALGSTPTLTIGSAATAPNTTTGIVVTFNNGGAPIAGIQNDIVFDPVNAPIAKTATGQPNCSLGTGVAQDGYFAFIPEGCTGADCTILRAVITNSDTIPSGALYQCTVAAGATLGTYNLAAFTVRASDAVGGRIQISGTNGTVTVKQPGCG